MFFHLNYAQTRNTHVQSIRLHVLNYCPCSLDVDGHWTPRRKLTEYLQGLP